MCSQNKPFLHGASLWDSHYCLFIDGNVTGCFMVLWLSDFCKESGEDVLTSLCWRSGDFFCSENYQSTYWLALIRINLTVFSSAGEVCGVCLSGHACMWRHMCVCTFACIHSSECVCVCVFVSAVTLKVISVVAASSGDSRLPWCQARRQTVLPTRVPLTTRVTHTH